MTRRGAAVERVRRALALRAAMPGLLAGCEPSVEERDAIQRAPEDAWRVLLACECCALPIAARLRQCALLSSLSAAAQRRIAAAELSELQRVLAARSTLEALDRACATLGIVPVVLKGAAIAAERSRPPIDLGDVDALVEERDVARLWTQLDALGWRRASGGRMQATPVRADANHFEALVPPGEGLPLELHTRLDYQGAPEAEHPPRIRLLEGRQVLHRLVGPDAVVTALRHSVVKHPHRRGHLRDHVMLAQALAECDGQSDRIERAFDGDPMAPELIAMCAQARAVAASQRIVDDPHTLRFVAWKYAAFAQPAGLLGRLPGWSGLNYLPLEREPIRRAEAARQLRYAVGPVPSTSPFAALGQRSVDARQEPVQPASVRRLSRTLRVLYRLALLALLALTSRSIRRRISAMSHS
jgi:hypothetical protein